MPSSVSNAKRSTAIQDTAAERWSRLYVDVRASYGRADIAGRPRQRPDVLVAPLNAIYCERD
jgi:hypothetical protein